MTNPLLQLKALGQSAWYDTIDTMPRQTIENFRNHGRVEGSIFLID